jgi:hypothetical protein
MMNEQQSDEQRRQRMIHGCFSPCLSLFRMKLDSPRLSRAFDSGFSSPWSLDLLRFLDMELLLLPLMVLMAGTEQEGVD